MKHEIKCPNCGSSEVAEVIYGLPAFTPELKEGLSAGRIVLEGCDIVAGGPMYPYECKSCGFRFDDQMAARPCAKAYFSDDDYAWLVEWSHADDDSPTAFHAHLIRTLLNDDVCTFERDLERMDTTPERLYEDPLLARIMMMGLEYGVACGDDACANFLGALYYKGEVVEQDYHRAKELFELAERKGAVQSMINLGYIYEYGRTGKPDYQKAFNQYAKAAAAYDSSEALYKLGDMYGRGRLAGEDLRLAYDLYRKSLKKSFGEVEQAQPAIRIAKLVGDPANEEWGIPYDPMRALELYQLAERGLRVDIAWGQTYYSERLQEAIEGQEKMRKILDDPTFKL